MGLLSSESGREKGVVMERPVNSILTNSLKKIFPYVIAVSVMFRFVCSGAADPKKQFVYDYAGVLNESQEGKLNKVVLDYDKSSTVQIAGIIIDSLKGKDIFDYSMGIFNEWGIGQRDVNNGALIVLALKERKVRITLGYGLEWPISDSTARSIIKEMGPFLKKGDYYNGFLTGFNKIIKLTKALSWEVEYKDFEQVENKESAVGKIGLLRVRTTQVTGNLIKANTPNGQEVLINTTSNMKDLIEQISKNQSYSLMTVRLIKSQPLTFDLLGVR